MILLMGCGSIETKNVVPSPTPANYQETLNAITEFDIVEIVNEDEILVGSTFYKIDKHTKMSKSNNQTLTIDELQPGDIVYVENTGYIMTSFPSQGAATVVILQNDSESLKVSESIRHFFVNQKNENTISTSIKELTAESITLHFYEWEIHGKKYEAIIDRATNTSTVREIENEEAIEQERRNKEMADAHPEGSTAGHITAIYENGFRINMADYTFSDIIHFNNDLGEELNKEDFKVGSFVSVEYDRLNHDSTIGKGILSKLTLLTKEENPEVRSWIQSIIEGNHYKDPVIMLSYSDHYQTYYTIRIADLNDNTPDTFEMKYDIESGTYSVTVNPG